MPTHDAYARLSPYELSFPDPESAREHFQAIRLEADARGADLRDPTGFVMLGATGQALREVRGAEDDPGLIRQHGLFLYHSFHFHDLGEPLYLLRVSELRRLLDTEPTGDWIPALRPAAGYAQLPQHLVWVNSGPDAPPESLDGFFWAQSGAERFSLLFALGMRPDRPGFSVVPFPDLPLVEAADWMRVDMREDGDDFTSSLPGAELEGLYELRSSGEALKLTARVLRRLGATRDVDAMCASPDHAEVGAPRPSRLRYRGVGESPGSGRSSRSGDGA